MKTKEELESEVKAYYGKSAIGNYATLFGENRHFGYFPHIDDPSKPKLTFTESTSALTEHMAKISNIDSSSRLIDFGCGAGEPVYDIARNTGCQALGVDLTPEHVTLASDKFASRCSNLEYMVGSITNLPDEIKKMPKFSHVMTMQVICHMAKFYKDVLREAHDVLDTNGIIVIDDFVVQEAGPTQKSMDYFFKRLHFDHLLSFADYAAGLTEAGFDIVYYQNATEHMAYGYQIAAPLAAENECLEYDGQPLSKHYEETSKCASRGEIGMVNIVARKK